MIATVAFMLAVVCAYFLWINPLHRIDSWDEQQGPTAAIAQLTQLHAQTKFRPAQSLAWRDAETGIALGHGDEVFTDQDSRATLLFNRGQELRLGPETLIRLPNANSDTIEMEEGSVHPVLAENTGPLSVAIGQETLTIEASGKEKTRLSITRTKTQTSIVALSGAGQVSLGKEKSLSLSAKEKMTFDHTSKNASQMLASIVRTTLPIEALAPSLADKQFLPAQESLRFAWRWSEKAPAEAVELVIASDPALKDVLARREIDGQITETTFKAWPHSGRLYWTLLSPGQKPSVVFDAEIQVIPHPVLILPSNSMTVYSASASVPVNIISDMPPPYRLIVSNGQDKKIFERELNQRSSTLELPSPETYTLKLAHQIQNAWHWSSQETLTISTAAVPARPVMVAPAAKEVRTVYGDKAMVSLKWQANCQSCDQWEIRSGTHMEQLNSETLRTNFHQLALSQSGDYLWQVRQGIKIEEQVIWSEWSELSSFKLNLLQRPSTPESGAVLELERPGEAVHFAWEEHPERDRYELQIASDDQFQTIEQRQMVDSEETDVAMSRAGTFYWRIIIHRRDGSTQFGLINQMIVKPAPPPAAPSLDKKMVVPLQWEERQSSISPWRHLLSFLINEAKADWSSFVDLKWPAVERAKEYQLNICRDRDCQQILVNQTLRDNHYRWQQASEGTYFWRVAVIDHWGQQSPFSETAQLDIAAGAHAPLQKSVSYLAPRHGEQFHTGDDINIQWQSDPNARHYRLEIADSLNFDHPIFSKETSETQFTWQNKNTGVFYWRVSAIGQLGDKVQGARRRLDVKSKFIAPVKEAALPLAALPPTVAPPPPPPKQIFMSKASQATRWRLPLIIGPMVAAASYENEGPSHHVELSGNQVAGLWGSWYQPWWSLDGHYIKLKVLSDKTFNDGLLKFNGLYPWQIKNWGRPIVGVSARSLPSFENANLSRRQASLAASQELYVAGHVGWQYLAQAWGDHLLLAEYHLGQASGPTLAWSYLAAKSFLHSLTVQWEHRSWAVSSNDNTYSTLTLKLGLALPP